MAKSLGQIHTVNKKVSLPFQILAGTEVPIADIDLPGELTGQLQRMVRAGNFFKTVGIDMSLTLEGDANRDYTVSGYIRYYAPTRGRCEAFRGAFRTQAEQMTMQGISMRDNKLYDFKTPINDAVTGFPNQATLDGSTGLCLNYPGNTGASVFGVHNASVRPVYEGSDVFDSGFNTLLQSRSGTDFVLNDVAPYTGNEMIADTSYETIPFSLTYSTEETDTTFGSNSNIFQWRPDPALYLAVLCGQFQIVLIDADSGGEVIPFPADLNISVMVSGWKSIMGNPDKKRKRSSSKRSKKTGK